VSGAREHSIASGTVAAQHEEMSSTEHPSRQGPAYLRSTSVIAMLSYSALLVAGFVYFLGYMPPVLPERAHAPAAALEVPTDLTKEDTLGYR
jgi:hypothetical protein